MNDVKYFKTQNDFRKWFEKNHKKAGELWVGYYKKSTGKPSIDWPHSVDEALCFGWIDGIRKSIDESSYKIRFTPRKPGSHWSAVNIKKIEELKKQGFVKPEGLKAFNMRKEEKSAMASYENKDRSFDEQYESMIKKNKKAWEYFKSQPLWYQRTAGWWIMSAKKEETRLKRLAILIDDSQNKKTIAPLKKPGKQQ